MQLYLQDALHFASRCRAQSFHGGRRALSTSPTVCRNRILFEQQELRRGGDGSLSTSLPTGDARAEHITKVLKLKPGDALRVGVVGGSPHAATLRPPPSPSDAPGPSPAVVLDWSPEPSAAHAVPDVDLLLAMPRPKVLRRLWAQLAALGVGAVHLTNAAKVERFYFDSHLSDGITVRSELLRGLEQAGDTRLPPVSISLRLRPLLDVLAGGSGQESGAASDHGDEGERARGDSSESESTSSSTEGDAAAERGRGSGADSGGGGLPGAAGEESASPWGTWIVGGPDSLPQRPSATLRLLAHPGAELSISEAVGRRAGPGGSSLGERVLLAVGPEGGWTDYELRLLKERGFQQVGLGDRALTTDVACIALISAIREARRSW